MDYFNPRQIKGLAGRKIKFKSRETIEPQEVLLDRLAKHKEEESGISEKKLEVPLSSKILKGFYYISLAILLLLFANTFYFDVIKGKDYSQQSKNNSQRIIYSRPERGVIYDAKMEQLVFNMPSFDLILDERDLPGDATQRKKIIDAVAGIIKQNPDDLQKEIDDSKTSEILVLENIPQQSLVLLEARISEFAGFRIEKNTVRSYKDGLDFAHLIGYMGKINDTELSSMKDYSINDYVGKAGLENFYQEILRGKPGKTITEKDVLGNKIKEYSVSSPKPGGNLVLYLNAGLQRKAAESLAQTLTNIGSKAGAVVAMDPRTGGILAMVSEPSFDNNLFSNGISQKDLQAIFDNPQKPLFNRVTSGNYATGSTIKPFMASAALQESIITPNTTVDAEGEIDIPNPYNPGVVQKFTDLHKYGITDVRKAIAVSCNVFFYTIGGGYGQQKGLGVTLIDKYLGLFGLGQKTGIDFPDEGSGLVPSPAWKESHFNNKIDKTWFLGDTYNLSIGQGYLSSTPLQVASAFSAIANNGKLMEPHIVQKIVDDNKNTITETQPKVVRENFISPENLQVVREGMRAGVTYGSSVTLNDLPVPVAAKTGTAQTPHTNTFTNWVSVFAPYDNPQIEITVMIDNVYGFREAVLPVAKDMLQWYFTQKQ